MALAETPTGSIVNGARIGIACAGILASFAAVVVLTYMLVSAQSLSNSLDRVYAVAALFAAGLLLLRISKNYSIQASVFVVPDLLSLANNKGVSARDVESMVKTLEANTGAAAFFNRIGFFGMSLGTIASALLVLLIGVIARERNYIDAEGFKTFTDLAKILFGAFVGSFAHGAISTSSAPAAPEGAAAPATPGRPNAPQASAIQRRQTDVPGLRRKADPGRRTGDASVPAASPAANGGQKVATG